MTWWIVALIFLIGAYFQIMAAFYTKAAGYYHDAAAAWRVNDPSLARELSGKASKWHRRAERMEWWHR